MEKIEIARRISCKADENGNRLIPIAYRVDCKTGEEGTPLIPIARRVSYGMGKTSQPFMQHVPSFNEMAVDFQRPSLSEPSNCSEFTFASSTDYVPMVKINNAMPSAAELCRKDKKVMSPFLESKHRKKSIQPICEFREDMQYGLSICTSKEDVIPLCNIIIEFICQKVCKKRDGASHSYLLVRAKNNLFFYDFSIPSDELYTGWKYLETNPRIHKYPGSGRVFREAFSAYLSQKYIEAEAHLPIEVEYDWHGWAEIDGKMMYLSSAYKFCHSPCYIPPKFDLSTERRAYLSGLHFLDLAKKAGDLNSDSKHPLTESEAAECYGAMLTIFLYSHCGFLAELFQRLQQEIQFVLVVSGDTNSLKSNVCKSFVLPFAYHSMLNFHSTEAALHQYLNANIDMNIVLDDISNVKNREAREKFEAIVRSIGDTVGRATCNESHDGINQIQVRSGCIVTSEDIPINQQSSSLRTLIVKIKRGTLSGEILEDFQYRTFGEHTLSHAYFSAFIHYVEDHYWRILNLVHTFEGGEVDLRFLRMRRTYRTLCIIAEIVLGWGHEIGTLSLECRDKMLDTWRRIIFDVVKENDDAAVVSEPYQVFLWGLRSLIIAHPHVLANSKTSYFMNTGNCIGYLEKGMYFLDQGETFLKVNELLAKHEKNLVAT